MTILLLIYEFFKTGLFAVGGGLATVPFLTEIAEKYDWFTFEKLMDMLAVSESTPGPLGVNMAVFAGFSAYGIIGGTIAALSLIAPSIIVIAFVSRFLEKFRENKIVSDVFTVLRPASAGLIAGAVFPLLIASVYISEFVGSAGINLIALGVYASLTLAVFLTDRFRVHPLIFIVIGAVLGIAIF